MQNIVEVTYSQTGESKATNHYGMCQTQHMLSRAFLPTELSIKYLENKQNDR